MVSAETANREDFMFEFYHKVPMVHRGERRFRSAKGTSYLGIMPPNICHKGNFV